MSEPTARPDLDVCTCGAFRREHPSQVGSWDRCFRFCFFRPATAEEIAFQDRVAEWEKANP